MAEVTDSIVFVKDACDVLLKDMRSSKDLDEARIKEVTNNLLTVSSECANWSEERRLVFLTKLLATNVGAELFRDKGEGNGRTESTSS